MYRIEYTSCAQKLLDQITVPPMQSSMVLVAPTPRPRAAALRPPARCRHRPSRGEQGRWGLRGYRPSWHRYTSDACLEKTIWTLNTMEYRWIWNKHGKTWTNHRKKHGNTWKKWKTHGKAEDLGFPQTWNPQKIIKTMAFNTLNLFTFSMIWGYPYFRAPAVYLWHIIPCMKDGIYLSTTNGSFWQHRSDRF